MIKHKKNSGKTNGVFSRKGQRFSGKKAESTYTLELLESRVLLSGDLAGAVQVMPIQPVQAPAQAVTLNIPAAPAATQQTFSVADMLAKPASSFPQYVGELGRANSNAANHAPDAVVSEGSGGARHQFSSEESDGNTQFVTPTVQSQPLTPQDSASVINDNASLLQPDPIPQMQNQPTLVTATAIQSDMATIPPSVQSQPSPQPIVTTTPTVVEAPVSAAQTISTSQVIAQSASSTPQLSNDPSLSQAISQSLVTPVQTVSPTLAPVQTVTSSSSLIQPTLSTTDASQQPTQPVSQPISTTTVAPTVPITTPSTSSTITSDAINPTLPQATVDTSMPTTSVTVRVGPHGDYTDLQTALNNVSLGTTILLEPGVTYTTTNDNGFVLPNKTTGTGWIVIRPDMPDSALPAPGTRVTSADSAWMPKIVRANSNVYAISSEAGAHNYRIIGVEVMNQGNVDTPLVGGALVNLSSTQETTIESQSNHILFDRTYIHGPSAGGSAGVKFGIVFGGRYEGVIDSTIQDITYGSDAIAVGSWSGAGPFIIKNNALSSSGENIMFGGANTQVAGLVPSDIEVTGNYIYKPLKWRDDPAYNSGPNKIIVKNLFEAKDAQRVLIDGNTFENMWPGAQAGFAMMFTPRQASATSNQPWTVVQDITITNNKIISTADGIAISGQDYGLSASGEPPTSAGGRYLIKNNLFLNSGGYAGTGIMFQMGNGVSDVTIQHNTIVNSTDLFGTTLMFLYGPANGDPIPMQRFVLQDNLFQARSYPYYAETGLASTVPGYIWTNNVFAGPWPTSGGWTAAMMPQGNGNAYPTNIANIGYINLAGGDYSLSSISPYKGAASDGTDIGINWNQFNAANS